MAETNFSGFSEENLRRIALKKIHFRMSVKVHIGIFIVVNILLVILNYLFTPNIIWMVFPLFGWLIGAAEHTTAYFIYARGIYPAAKAGVIFHTVAYIFGILLLFVINFVTTPSFYWVIFPAIFWGVALAINLIAYIIYFRSSIDERGTIRSRTQRAVEKELEKMRKKMNKS